MLLGNGAKCTVRHVHWGLPDPAAISASKDEARKAVGACFGVLQRRIGQLVEQAARSTGQAIDIGGVMEDIAREGSPLDRPDKALLSHRPGFTLGR